MAQDKKKNESALSFLESNISWETSKKGWLNFSEWFTYKNQDLDSVHNSADDIKEINRTKVGSYIWNKISTGTLSDSDIKNRTDSMSMQQIKWFNEKAKTNEYDLNTLYAYIDHWDERKNPYAAWTWMFEKKWGSASDWTSTSWLKTARNLWLWELWWAWTEWVWNKWYNRATRPTQRDTERQIVDEAAAKKYNKAEEEYKKVTKKLANMKKWDAWYDALKKEQTKWANEMKRYDWGKRDTTVDVLNEEGIAWWDKKMAVDSDYAAWEKWQTELEPVFEASTSKYNKQSYVKKLTPDLFKDVNESDWKKYYAPIIERWTEDFGDWEMTLRELEDFKQTFHPSEAYIWWDKATSAEKRLTDKMYEIIWEDVASWLEKTKKWAWATYSKYWRLKEAYGNFKSKAATKAAQDKTIPTIKELISDTSWQRKTSQWMEKLGKLRPTKIVWAVMDFIGKHKKIASLIWLWALVFKNPVVQAGLTALEVAWDVDMANDAWNFIDDYRKFVPKVQRINARFADKDTRIWWEFAWMTEEEKEKKYPMSEVLEDLQWLSDNWYEDFILSIPWFSDLEYLWGYAWWRLKNTWEKDAFQNFVENRGKIPEKTPWEELKANIEKLNEEKEKRYNEYHNPVAAINRMKSK